MTIKSATTSENPSQSGLVWKATKRIKFALISFSMISLVASNVASLTNTAFHGFLYDGLNRVLLIAGSSFADLALSKSPTRAINEQVKTRTSHLQMENEKVSSALKTEKALNEKLAADKTLLQVENNALKSRSTEVRIKAKNVAAEAQGRMKKVVVRNTSSIPAEAIPYIGIGVTLSVTALDIMDACETMKSINGLLAMLGQTAEVEDLCVAVNNLPSRDQVLSQISAKWTESMRGVIEEARKTSKLIPQPEVRLPTKEEMIKLVCPLQNIPWLCS